MGSLDGIIRQILRHSQSLEHILMYQFSLSKTVYSGGVFCGCILRVYSAGVFCGCIMFNGRLQDLLHRL